MQWIYVPAVKDATTEDTEAKNTALGKILARTVRAKVTFDEEVEQLREEALAKYQKLLESQQSALDEISKSLTTRLNQWAHPEARARLTWTADPRKSVQVEEPIARDSSRARVILKENLPVLDMDYNAPISWPSCKNLHPQMMTQPRP